MRLAAQTRGKFHPPHAEARGGTRLQDALAPVLIQTPSGLVGASAEPGIGRTDALEGRMASY